MLIDRPNDLMLAYTRLMMGFLLFSPNPRSIAMIGLGGGSLAKFCYHHLPETRIQVLEINPHVIALRNEFKIPPDDHRFNVRKVDAVDYVRRAPHRYDVIMADGFDANGVPPGLCSQSFYEDCRNMLEPGGVLVTNLHSIHPHFSDYLERLAKSFDGHVIAVGDPECCNVIVFAYTTEIPAALLLANLKRCATTLAPEAWLPGLPLAFSGILGPEQAQELQSLGCLSCEEPTHAVDAMARLYRWQAAAVQAHDARAVGSARQPAGVRNEVEGMAWLVAHGVPAVPHRVAHDAQQAVDAWRALGAGPAVIKIVSRDILHKSDVGGVRMGPRTEDEVREACTAILASVAQKAPQAAREGLLVARCLKPRVELMLGARHDPVFGAIVVLGLGGVAVELHARTVILSAPTQAARVRELLERLGVVTLMGAWRGQRAIDDAPLVDAVLNFARGAASLGPTLRSVEINPLMVTEDGVFAADAVLEIE